MNRCKRVLSRTWLSLMVFTLVMVALVNVLQPRPRVYVRTKVPELANPLIRWEARHYSPQHRYLGLIFENTSVELNNETKQQSLLVLDVLTGASATRQNTSISHNVVRDDGSVVYLQSVADEKHELIEWKPFPNELQSLRTVQLPGSENQVKCESRFGTWSFDWPSVLSPAGDWWLYAQSDGTSAWFERYEIATKKHFGRLASFSLPRDPAKRHLDESIASIYFTDADTVFVETHQAVGKGYRYRGYWINVRSNQVIREYELPAMILSLLRAGSERFVLELENMNEVATLYVASIDKPDLQRLSWKPQLTQQQELSDADYQTPWGIIVNDESEAIVHKWVTFEREKQLVNPKFSTFQSSPALSHSALSSLVVLVG